MEFMRSPQSSGGLWLAISGVLFGSLLLGGCAGLAGTDAKSAPEIRVEGTRPRSFTDLYEIAQKSNAIVLAKSTGKSDSVPLPGHAGTEGAAPTTFLQMSVSRVLDGKVSSTTVRVVANVDDKRTGKPVLAGEGLFLLFLAPAMYGANDPAGGYVVAGGPSGMYAASDQEGVFLRIDPEAAEFPETIDISDPDALPAITKSEELLLREGP